MEKYLGKFRLTDPPADLAEKVLAAARSAEPLSWADRLWASRTFWLSVAAGFLVCFVLNRIDAPGVPVLPAGEVRGIPWEIVAQSEESFLEQYLNAQSEGSDSRPSRPKKNTILNWRLEQWPAGKAG